MALCLKLPPIILLLIPVMADMIRAQTVQYHLTDLGTLGGTVSWARGINNHGQIVGFANLPNDGTRHAFLYNGSTMIDLGALGSGASTATAINDNGQVVGYFEVGLNVNRAFLYTPGSSMQDIGMSGGGWSYAYDINDVGQIAGQWQDARGIVDCYIYENGAITALGIRLSHFSCGINNNGQVVGTMPGSKGYDAFFYNGSTVVNIGNLGGAICSAVAVNDLGQVVGRGLPFPDNNYVWHAFRYDSTTATMTDLGSLTGAAGSSEAHAINRIGQIVGIATTPDGPHAFLHSGSMMTDLNTLLDSSGTGYTVRAAYGINDRGQIVGYADIHGESHAMLLTPIPEPATTILLCFGAVGLMIYRWSESADINR